MRASLLVGILLVPLAAAAPITLTAQYFTTNGVVSAQSCDISIVENLGGAGGVCFSLPLNGTRTGALTITDDVVTDLHGFYALETLTGAHSVPFCGATTFTIPPDAFNLHVTVGAVPSVTSVCGSEVGTHGVVKLTVS